jgi:thiamine biosynthesis protein ThiS
VRIRVNGDPVELPAELTILQLLEQLNIDPRLVAVEHNLSIIKRALYESTLIGEGDQIEIVNFVGGGAESGLVAQRIHELGT